MESTRCKCYRSFAADFVLAVALCYLSAHVVDALLPVPSALDRSIPGGAGVETQSKGGSFALPGPLSCVRDEVGRDAIPSLSRPVLELITPDGCATSSDTSSLIRSVERAVAGGVSLVQLRDYRSGEKSKGTLALRLRAATEGRALFVVNGDLNAARACDADGIHLPERMLGRLVGLRNSGEWPRVVGCSVHSVAAALDAAKLGADYVQVRHELYRNYKTMMPILC